MVLFKAEIVGIAAIGSAMVRGAVEIMNSIVIVTPSRDPLCDYPFNSDDSSELTQFFSSFVHWFKGLDSIL